MKITKERLRQVIKEELKKVLQEEENTKLLGPDKVFRRGFWDSYGEAETEKEKKIREHVEKVVFRLWGVVSFKKKNRARTLPDLEAAIHNLKNGNPVDLEIAKFYPGWELKHFKAVFDALIQGGFEDAKEYNWDL